MNSLYIKWRALIFVAVLLLSCRVSVVAAAEPTLTKDQIKQFLLNAKMVSSHDHVVSCTLRTVVRLGGCAQPANTDLELQPGFDPCCSISDRACWKGPFGMTPKPR